MPEEVLPYGRQVIDDDDIAAVVAALRADMLTTGPLVARFEQAFADRVGAAYAVACNSGTAALHLAVDALGIGPADAVVVPTLTFLATANCARFCGADVIFADVDPDTGLLTPATFSAALARAQRRVRAVIPVHLAGQVGDLAAIRSQANAADIAVIEDACHALGTRYEADPGSDSASVGACAHSDLATFSFHPVKTIAVGEGGMVTTNDNALATRMAEFRSHGMVRDAARLSNAALAFDADGTANPWYYEMPRIGYNYRVSDINCALGLSQLGKLDAFVARRAALSARYDELLGELAPSLRLPARTPRCTPGWHLYAARFDFAAIGRSRAQVMRALRAEGVGTQVHYLPVHRQPYYQRLYGDITLPGADAYYASTLSLPLFPAMRDDDVDRVCAAVRRVIGA
ncbi:MAG: UDP-4-amino-4,6-dideoxy-N-acetyl-beta-L-altrosamine transaminase [Gammaproteobacteria bacterium]